MNSPVTAPKRVLHLIESGGIYGAERVIVNLSREMAAERSFAPVIGCIVQRDSQPVALADLGDSLGIESHRVRIANRLAPLHIVSAARRIRELGIDLIHCHGYKPTVFAYAIGALARIPVMATCHLWFVDRNAPLKMRALIAVEKSLYKRFPAVVAVSEDIRKILLGAGVSPERASLIRNGIVLADYAPAALRVVAPDALDENDFCVLNVGRLTEQKAQADLIRAAVLVRMTHKQVKFLIVGDGELRADLTQQIRAAGLEDCVSLPGFRSAMGPVLGRADLFVLPSLDEGMPISLLEAVAAHVAVVATAVGDIPKLIVNGENGIIVPKRDPASLAAAIRKLVDDPDRRTQLADRAWQALSAAYSSRQMYEQYARVYGAVLSGPATGQSAAGRPATSR